MFAGKAFSFAEELSSVNFGDTRLNKRSHLIMDRALEFSDKSLYARSQSWAEAMGSYRFFSNRRVQPMEFFRAHHEQLLKRAREEKIVIVSQDTTSLNFSSHQEAKGFGPIHNGFTGRDSAKGCFVHTAEVINEAGVPIGLLAQEVWSRKEGVKGPGARQQECGRWLRVIEEAAAFQGELPDTKVYCVSDRESDADINIEAGQQLGLRVIVRAKHKGRAVGVNEKMSAFIQLMPPEATVEFEFRDNQAARKRWNEGGTKLARRKRFKRTAHLELRYTPIQTINGLEAWAVLVSEPNPPKGVEPIEWLLLSSFPITNLEEATRAVNIYKLRWEIEIFHKIMKSGCKIESARLDDFKKIEKYVAAMSLVAWRLQVLTKLSRQQPESPCDCILEQIEWLTMQAYLQKPLTKKPPSLSEVNLMIARLGGYFPRKTPPGVQTVWRGWARLMDMTAATRAFARAKVQNVYNR